MCIRDSYYARLDAIFDNLAANANGLLSPEGERLFSALMNRNHRPVSYTHLKTRERRLRAFQEKLASLNFLDPACGSGNFLTETYLSLRKLENEVLSLLLGGQIAFGFGELNPIKVSIGRCV